MEFVKSTCEDFTAQLSSKSPVPGGGGASALAGALGAALGGMVASLTIGKKKYAEVEGYIIQLKEKTDKVQKELLELIDKDAEAFEPLAKAYGMPKGTEEEKAEKAKVMEGALKAACSAPYQIMEKCCEAIELLKEFAEKGSTIAISDAGVGAVFCKAALQGAALNVFINTKAMEDKEYASEINRKAQKLLEKYELLADEIYEGIAKKLT